MVSQRDLEQVVTQINSSYSLLVARIAVLEAQVARNTNKKESKEKS